MSDSERSRPSIDQEFVRILRSPTGQPLRLEDDSLVACDGRTFPIVDSIPVLLEHPKLTGANVTDTPKGASPPEHLRRTAEIDDEALTDSTAIVSAFVERSSTYYTDNYASGSNPSREARQRLIESLLAKYVARDSLVIEVGSGPMVLFDAISTITKRYVAIDLSLSNLLAGHARVGPAFSVCANVTALPFASNSFDTAIAIGCLEYVRELTQAIKEICRVTRSGGQVMATFANKASPARFWDEHLVLPIARRRAERKHLPTYRRSLTSLSTVHGLFEAAGGVVGEIAYVNQGLVGYPMSSSRSIRGLAEQATSGIPLFRRLSSEIVVVAEIT